MKSRRWLMHLFYLFVIGTLLVGIGWMNRIRKDAIMQLQLAENVRLQAVERAFAQLCSELSGDLFSAVEADTDKLYLSKLSEMQTAVGQAILLLSEDGRQTPWIVFWQSMETYLRQEQERMLDGGALADENSDFIALGEVMQWLAEHPAVILDESTDSLPEGLKLPTLQTAFGVDKDETQRIAMRVLGVHGGLTEMKNTPPGIRGYTCGNARVDVMQSGELLYFSAAFKPKNGEIDNQTASDAFLQFAKTEGFGNVKIIDLYHEDSLIRGKLAPLRQTAEFGLVPDLDRTMEIACTAWSGRICYFSAGRYFSSIEKLPGGRLLSESQIEALARQKGARIGLPFLYRGKLCRPMIYERVGWSGRSILCIDASSGESVDLFYLQHPRVSEPALF